MNRVLLEIELIARNRFSISIQYFKTSDEERKRIEASQDGDGWMVMLDTYGKAGRDITDIVGTKCQTLMKSYGCHVVRSKATQMGWSLREEVLQDGVVFTARPKHQQQKASW